MLIATLSDSTVNLKSSIQLQREESTKSLKIVERCFLFCQW